MSAKPPKDESEVIELIRSLDTRAPERLQRRTEELIAEHSRGERPRAQSPARERLRLGGALAALAAVALALVLALSSTSSAPLSTRNAAAVTMRAATSPAPAESTSERSRLNATVDGIAFPYWEERFGWHASGSRADRVAGRSVQTVFYSDGSGHRVGYSILVGAPPRLEGAPLRWRGEARYRLLSEDGGQLVVWLRDGHLCVVGGRGLSAATLLALASWNEHGSTA